MKIVLLDRDGTIIAEPKDKRVDSVNKIKPAPYALEALTYFAYHGFAAIIITNQAGIGEGRISREEFEHINNKVIERLKPSSIEILNTYMCPHALEENCNCRKPAPGMLLQAAEDFNFDLSKTFMVGDRLSDVQAGANAGTQTVLINSQPNKSAGVSATYITSDLLDAAKYIVKNS